MSKSETTCKQAHCPCSTPCPLMLSLELIGGKWKIPILCSLHQDGPLRYSELKRRITGITNTMLASTLKDLEACALVQRTQYPEMPVRVEYSATEKCSGLIPILQHLAKWGMDMNQSASAN